MLLALLFAAEILLAAAILIPIFLWSVPAGIIVGVLLLGFLALFRPELRLARAYRDRHRAIAHRAVHVDPGAVIGVQPSVLPTAEVARLLEAAGMLSPLYARSGAFCSTVLSLNCRGVIRWHPAIEPDEVVLTVSVPENAALSDYEKELLALFDAVSGKKGSFSVAEFASYASRHAIRAQRCLDRFDAMTLRALTEKKCVIRRKIGKKTELALSRRGEEEAALWRAYFLYLRDYHPEFLSYPDDMDGFRTELETCLCQAEAAGVFRMVQEKLLTDYVFEPAELWEHDRMFALLHNADEQTRLSLRKISDAIVSYGSDQYVQDGLDDILKYQDTGF